MIKQRNFRLQKSSPKPQILYIYFKVFTFKSWLYWFQKAIKKSCPSNRNFDTNLSNSYLTYWSAAKSAKTSVSHRHGAGPYTPSSQCFSAVTFLATLSDPSLNRNSSKTTAPYSTNNWPVSQVCSKVYSVRVETDSSNQFKVLKWDWSRVSFVSVD